MSFGLSYFVLWVLTGEVSKFVACLALAFLSRTCETIMMGSITTLWTSILIVRWWHSVWHWQFVVTFVLVMWLTKILVISARFIVTWSGFCMRPFFLIPMLWYLVLWWHSRLIWVLGVPQILVYVPCSGFWAFIFLGQLVHSACREFVQVYTAITDVLDTKSSSFRKKTKDVTVEYFGCFWGYLAKFTCACMTLYHSSMLQFPCLKLVSKSNLAWTSFDCGLQYSSYFPHIVSRVSSFEDRFQDTYWSILQSPLHAITFLHCWHFRRAASLHSKIFLHLRCHLRNLCYRWSLTVQSICGPSYRAYTWPAAGGWPTGCGGSCRTWWGWNDTSGSSSWSELGVTSWVSTTSSPYEDVGLDLCADLLVVVDILGDLIKSWTLWTVVELVFY